MRSSTGRRLGSVVGCQAEVSAFRGIDVLVS